MKLRLAALLSALLCLSLLPCNQALAKAKKKSDPATIVAPRFSVYSPLGIPPAIKTLAMAPRPNTLDGKTIYIVDDGPGEAKPHFWSPKQINILVTGSSNNLYWDYGGMRYVKSVSIDKWR